MKPVETEIVGYDPGAYQTAVAGTDGRLALVRSCVAVPSSRNVADRDLVTGCDWSGAQSPIEPYADGRFRFLRPDCSPMELRQARAAAQRLARHAVSHIVPHANGPLLGVIPLPSRASEFNRQFVGNSVRDLFDACLFVPSPLAISYGLNCLDRTLVVDVGAGTVDMSLIDGEYPGMLDQITLPVGLSRMDRAFQERVRTRHGIDLTVEECRKLREQHGAVRGDVSDVVITGTDCVPLDVSQCLAEACGELVISITTALRELAQGGSRKPETVILTGGGSQLNGLARVISDLIPESELIVPPRPALSAATGALCMGQELSPELWRELVLTAGDDVEMPARSAA